MRAIPEHQKYYWLKLKRDFFKRHDVRIIEEMPNGKDYILFYLKLLLESVDHNGKLRFSDTIPYNEQMLSVITHTNIDIVRSAMKVFMELQMVEVLDDQTIYMTEVDKLVGSETPQADRMRKCRERKKLANCHNVTQMLPNGDTELELELELEKELEKELELDTTITEPNTHAKPYSFEATIFFSQFMDEEKAKTEGYRWYQYNEQRGWDCLPDWKSAATRWIEKI